MLRPIAILLILLSPLIAGSCAADPDAGVARQHESQRRVMSDPRQPRQVITSPLPAGEVLVFSSFREPGYGLHLSISRDGLTWRDVSDSPIFVPQIGELRGVRDPCIARGPDGVYHMVWTWAVHSPRSIGYARSDDLRNWTDVRSLEVMPPEIPSEACWAPEIFYDRDADEWLIVWSSEITGRFPDTDRQAEANHRLYACTTTDFRALSPPRLFYDPGFPVIDPDIVENPGPEGGVIMFFKDEREWGKAGTKKQIRYATAPTVFGPWSAPSPAITLTWVEGPSAIYLGGAWIVYFDEYTRRRYGAVRSDDLVKWSDISYLLDFPAGHRHGSVLRIPEETARALERR